MLGLYENFPPTIHHTETFASLFSRKKMQKKIAQVFHEVNGCNFSFEEAGNPTIPGGIVIFEFGIADETGFVYLNEEENQKMQNSLNKTTLQIMDWFCSIRYYKTGNGKRTPLKFDYYMLRLGFAEKDAIDITVFHERGPRYLTPQDLCEFIYHQVNKTAKRKSLKRLEKS
jgi:hypothetical protein